MPKELRAFVNRKLHRHYSRTHVLIACMPKSASTFVSRSLAQAASLRIADIAVASGRSEQEISADKAWRENHKNYVAHMHVTGNQNTKASIERFGMVPVVLTRNLLDCVASLRDHIRNESPEASMAWFDESHAGLEDSDLEDAIADLAMPWYIRFHVSWWKANALRLNYEDVIGAPGAALEAIADAARIDLGSASIDAPTPSMRFNKGVSGRGQVISAYAKDRIRGLTRHYPDVDFSSIL